MVFSFKILKQICYPSLFSKNCIVYSNLLSKISL